MAYSSTRNASRLSASRIIFLAVIMLLAISSHLCFFVAGAGFRFEPNLVMPNENPYKVLGIKLADRNNMDVIKKAYREEAMATHPDKNPDLEPEEANRRFYRVNEAWEFLSDKDKKKTYDKKLRNGGGHRKSQSFHKQRPAPQRRNQPTPTPSWHQNFHNKPTEQKGRQYEEQQQRARERDREKSQKRSEDMKKTRLQKEARKRAKEAQDSIFRFTTLQQLIDAGIVDQSSGLFTKHLLVAFVANKAAETKADYQYLFPYPFGPTGRNGMDWGPYIQTAKVRYNKSTPITQAFRIHTQPWPHIIFVRKGTKFKSQGMPFNEFVWNMSKNQNDDIREWILNMLQTRVNVVNNYPEGGPSIRIFFDQAEEGTSGNLRAAGVEIIPPGYQLDIPARLSDRMIVLDATTNEFIGSHGIRDADSLNLGEFDVENVAIDNIVVSKYKQSIEIGTGYGTTRNCYDLSDKCYEYTLKRSKCQNLSTFAHAMCAKSCGVCIESPTFNGIHYVIEHTPLHRVPSMLRPFLPVLRQTTKFCATAGHDFNHIWTLRRNVAFGFFAVGLLLGLQIVLLACMLLGRTRTYNPNHAKALSPVYLMFLIALTGFVLSLLIWVSDAPEHNIPDELIGFRKDLVVLLKTSKGNVLALFGLGIVSLVSCKVLTYRLYRRPDLQFVHHAVLLASTIVVSLLMVVGTNLYLEKHKRDSDKHGYHIKIWKKTWKYYKNVAVTLIGYGYLFGYTLVALVQYAKHRFLNVQNLWYLGASLTNMSAGCGLLSMALLDKHFVSDLEHVASMRMAAAIPCLLVGTLLGLCGAHRLCSAPSKTTSAAKIYRGAKQKNA